MKLLLSLSLLLSSVMSNTNNVCVWGPGTVPRKGGLYDYKGGYNGKPYYQQRNCVRTFYNGIGPAGGIYLFSMIEDDGETQRYHIGYELGVINPTKSGDIDLYPSDIYCDATNINHPSECSKWVNTDPRNDEPLTVYADGCPDIFKDDIIGPVLERTGSEAIGIQIFSSGMDDTDGKYNIKLGLNMFKKETLSADGNAIYLYFDPYYFTWRFISGFKRDGINAEFIADPYKERDPTDDEWKGVDSDIFTCPIYSSWSLLESSYPINYQPPASEWPYNPISSSDPHPSNPSWDSAFGPWYDASWEWYFDVYFNHEGETRDMIFFALTN